MLIKELPPDFQLFLQQHHIDPDLLLKPTRRYVRAKPNLPILDSFQDIAPVPWIPDLYSIPLDHKISDHPLYRQAKIYGIDLASAAVVLALDLNQNDRTVLDLCCAPGAKLMYIADLLPQNAKVTGVDISQNRLNVTRSLVKKYALEDKVELVQEDGTKYQTQHKFDKVLVDAECTHEGSVKHLEKFLKNKQNDQEEGQSKKKKKQQKQSEKQLKLNHTNIYTTEQRKKNEWSLEDFKQRFLDPLKLEQLRELQSRLLRNGFEQVKVEGYLVYSTCSYSRQQNEDIVNAFLEEKGEKVRVVEAFKKAEGIPCKSGGVEKSVRFDGQTSNSGGMFLIKMQKVSE